MKKKFIVYGNCQAKAIAMTMLCCEEFSENYEYIDIMPCFATSLTEQYQIINNNYQSIDLLFSQYLKNGWHSLGKMWDIDFLKSNCLRKEGVFITYPEIYSRFSNPALVYPKTFPRLQDFDYLDLLAVYLYDANILSVDNYLIALNKENLFDISNLQTISNISKIEFNLRKSKTHLKDVDLSGIFNADDSSWFHTFNHPSCGVVKLWTNSLLSLINTNYFVNTDTPDILNTVKFPTYKQLTSKFNDKKDIVSDIVVYGGNVFNLADYIKYIRSKLDEVQDKLKLELEIQRQDPISNIVLGTFQHLFSMDAI